MNDTRLAHERFCKDRFPLPSEKQIADFEQRIGVELPDDYRRYILDYNGGFFTEPQIVPVVERCPTDRLTFMHGLGATHPVAELASDHNLGLFDNNYPAQVLPIGYTLMGNLILLITHPEHRGCIMLKRAFYNEYFFLAVGIEQFFALLRDLVEE